MEFKIDYGTLRASPVQAPPGPLLASIGGRVSSLANDEVVFYDPVRDATHVMTAQVLQALDLCRSFRRLDEHVATVVEKLPGLKGQPVAVRRVLEGLIGRGLLISDSDFLARFDAVTAESPAPFAGICIRACDRPAMLRRLLDSLVRYEGRYSSQHRYWVIDDSTSTEAEREHHALLQSFAEAAKVEIEHISQRDWRTRVDRLARQLPEQAKALVPMLTRDPNYQGRRGGGIGKNLITLLTAGQRYALLDDDFVFDMRRHPEFREGLFFNDLAWGARTFDGVDAALAAGIEWEGDPVALQLSLCGRPLAAIANKIDGCRLSARELRNLPPSRLSQLDPLARVAATLQGHRGDAGASGMGWLFVMNAAERAGYTDSRESYLAALDRPAVWYGARGFQVVQGSNFTPFLIDNSRFMPCTSPFGRSEDALFSALSGALWQNSVAINVPMSIGHCQEGKRDRRSLLTQPETPDVNLCIAQFVRQVGADLVGIDPDRRRAVIVASLRDLAASEERHLLMHLREFLAYLRSSLVQALQHVLAETKQPPLYWAADLRALVEANGRALTQRTPPRFAGWPADAGEALCVALFRKELNTLADGLEVWSTVWDTARQELDFRN